MDDAPATFDSSFKGQQSESGGVVGMLEVPCLKLTCK